MTQPTPARLDVSWRRRDALALTALTAIAAAFIVWEQFQRPISAEAFIPVMQSRVELARERIDPQIAGVASLRRLPGIGPVKAKAIVDYRAGRPGAFAAPDDLRAVSGIGPVAVRKMTPYLSYPQTNPAQEEDSQE